MRIALTTSVVLTLSSFSWAATIHVPAEQPTIQAGIDAALESDTVLVAPGTYTGDGNRDLDFHGKDIVLMSEGGRELTIVDCEGTATDRHRGFHLSSGESAEAVIEGFTFTNGYETIGAGGWCVNSASPTIQDCAFTNNTAEGTVSNDTPGYWEIKDAGRGGAVTCKDAAAQFYRCIFAGNAAISGYQIANSGDAPEVLPGQGGAARVGGTSAGFAECSFESNAADEGGAIYLRRNNTTLTDNTFNSNSALLGGAVHCVRANPTISRNDFTMNTATNGGAIYCTLNSRPRIRRNTIEGGTAADGGAIYLAGSNATITDNFIRGNTASAAGGGISCYQGSAPEIADNDIGNNLSGVNGGGIFIGPSAPTIFHNVIWGNAAFQLGGGISCSSSDATITNNTIAHNTAGSGGSGIALVGASLTVESCIIASIDVSSPISCTDGAEPTLSHCDMYCDDGGNWTGCIADQADINGNFTADPMFCDVAGNDYHISVLSPCAAGNNSSGSLIGALEANCGSFVCGDTDLDGELTEADIDALMQTYYSFVKPLYYPTPVIDMDCDGIITISDLILLAGYYHGYGPDPCCAAPPKFVIPDDRGVDAGSPDF
jgi:hypothetical protein